MSEVIPVRARPLNAIAIVTVLALLAAPICAPLCAAGTCSSSTRQVQCHEMGTMGADGGEQFVAPSKACGASDFSAVLVKADEQSLLLQEQQRDTHPTLIDASSGDGLGSCDESLGRWGLHRVPLKSTNLLLPGTILRI